MRCTNDKLHKHQRKGKENNRLRVYGNITQGEYTDRGAWLAKDWQPLASYGKGLKLMEEVIIKDCRLILGDCSDVLPTLGKFDLLLTDPPYGIGADKGKKGAIPFKGGKPVEMAFHPDNEWDDERADIDLINQCVSSCKASVIWGGNYFADGLTPQGRWLWWDKCQTMPSYGDGELAWTNFSQKTPKKFTLSNNKIIADRVERHHPTQKPIQLIHWCINLAPSDCLTIFDPFMGSGTTGVACANMGRKFTGIERERKYFDIACERIENAYRQERLFA